MPAPTQSGNAINDLKIISSRLRSDGIKSGEDQVWRSGSVALHINSFDDVFYVNITSKAGDQDLNLSSFEIDDTKDGSPVVMITSYISRVIANMERAKRAMDRA